MAPAGADHMKWQVVADASKVISEVMATRVSGADEVEDAAACLMALSYDWSS